MEYIDYIIDFINGWLESKGLPQGTELNDFQITEFVSELQEQISLIDFSFPKGTTIIGYSGESNGTAAWEIVKQISESMGEAVVYISDLPAGQLINDEGFKRALKDLLDDGEIINKIISGYENGERLEGGKCGYGDYLSLDDFVSTKLMGESIGVSDNIIIFIPEEVNPNKVFATTEIEKVFENNTFKYINGIPKEELAAIYNSGPEGKVTVYQILSRLSQEVVGDATGIEEQAALLQKSFGESGILNSSSGEFSINVCYDALGNKLGYELFSKSNGASLLSNYSGEKYLLDGIAENVTNKLSVKEYTNALSKSTIYLDEAGNIIGQSYKGTALDGIVKDTVPSEYTYSTKYDIYNKLAGDASMSKRWGSEYDTLSSTEKYQAKELDYLARVAAGMAEPEEIAAAALNYCKGAGKTLEELNAVDKAIINFCSDKTIDASRANKLLASLESSGKLSKLAKGAEAAGVAVVTVVSAVTVYDTVTRANEAIDNGNYYEAAAIVAGSSSDLAITFIGGEALTGALSPYLAGAGMVIAGPVGAVVGELLSGVIGFGVSSLIGGFVEDLFEGLGGFLEGLFGNANSAVRYVADPLVIDLDGDGFELLSVKEGVYFDEDAKGLVEKTSWVSSDDALLAIDLNEDGVINDGSELFGTSTVLSNGKMAKSGFQALMQYDENKDNIIDENDAVYEKLKIWQDKNSDGISSQDELYSLRELGIESISLNTTEDEGIVVSSVNYEDGSSAKIGEFNFEAQLYNTIEKEKAENNEDIKDLPNVRSIGNIASLHTLIKQDETGTLKEYVQQFANSSDRSERERLITDILMYITGANNIDSSSRGSQIDAKKLTVIEKFMGKEFVGTAGVNPVNTAAEILNSMYDEIYRVYYSFLNAETSLKSYMGLIHVTENEAGSKYINTDMFNSFIAVCTARGADMTEVVADMGLYISAVNIANEKNFNDYLAVYSDNADYAKAILMACKNNVYVGTDGDDTLSGKIGNDYLLGGSGNDTISAIDGNDKIYGGTGNDILNGGHGDDTYFFNLGDGEDVIKEDSNDLNADRIVFGEGIEAENILIERIGEDLIIKYSADDKIIIKNAYKYKSGHGYGYYFVESIEFADGTVWDTEEIGKRASIHIGTEEADVMTNYETVIGYTRNETYHAGAGNDTIEAGLGDDIIYGESGDDTIIAGGGNDKLYGGDGNDILDGGYGDDTYYFNLGDGEDIIKEDGTLDSDGTTLNSDRIVFGEGIKAEDILLERVGEDLIIRYNAEDKIIIKNAYKYKSGHGYGCYFVESIEFADGTVWDTEEIGKRASIHIGTEEADVMTNYETVIGYTRNETYHAGAGNDTIEAGLGDDIIYGESGDDTIIAGGGNDKLYGGDGNDILDGGYGDDTYYFNLGDGEDIIKEDGTLDSDGTTLNSDRIVFGEGIKAEDILLERVGEDLIIRYNAEDKIIIKNAYKYKSGHGYGCYFVESIEFADGTVWDTEEIGKRASIHIGTEEADVMTNYETVIGYTRNETYHAGAGNDTIEAGLGDDIIYGESGDDTIIAGGGNDKLYGGDGNDILDGGYGDDTYYFNLGDGEDIIKEDGTLDSDGTTLNSDRIVFGEGIKAEDILLERVGEDLIIRYNAEDKIIIKNAYKYKSGHGYGCYFVESIEFADGTVWDTEEIGKRASIHIGTEEADVMTNYETVIGYTRNETYHAGAGNDTIEAGLGDDIIYGESGDDTIIAGGGNDKLYGGDGNDILDGGYGDDTYYFNLGDGEDIIKEDGTLDSDGTTLNSDRIVFGEGIKAEDILLERVGEDLIIRYNAEDKIIIKNAYKYKSGHGYGCYFVESIEFADGTVWDTEEIGKRASIHIGTEEADVMTNYETVIGYTRNETYHAGAGNDTIEAGLGDDIIYGESGDDTIIAGDGNDKLYGGAGNDILDGGYGDDTYYFNLGDGEDIIKENSNTLNADRIVFGEGIKLEDILLERIGEDLIIKYSANDKVTIKNAYGYKARSGYGYYYVEDIEFSGTAIGKIDYQNVKINVTEYINNDNIEEPLESYTTDIIETSCNTEELIDNCAEMVNSLYTSEQSGAGYDNIELMGYDKEYNNIYYDNSETLADNMANLLIQDMSESTSGNIVSINEKESSIANEDNVQLWVQ